MTGTAVTRGARRRAQLLLLAAALAGGASLGPAASAAVLPPQIHTVAGGGTCTNPPISPGVALPCNHWFAGGDPIYLARAVAALPNGGFLYADFYDHLIQEVTAEGFVTTVAGNGSTVDGPDGSLAIDSGINGPVAVTPLAGGGFLITEYNSAVVRMVSPGAPGQATITTIAGTGAEGSGGALPGPATSVELDYPSDAEVTPGGQVLIADTGNDRILLLSSAAPGATATSIAGGGACNDDDPATPCDGLSANAVELNSPVSVSPVQSGAGGYLIAENGADDNTVRKVSEISPSGTFSTVAGKLGPSGYSGNGGPATSAQLNQPSQVSSLTDGGFLIADSANEVIRSVSPSGIITTAAGDGSPGYTGDDGSATAATLQTPTGVSPNGEGGFFIADSNNNVVREVTVAPVTTITLQKTALGRDGWYVDPVTPTITTTEDGAISCELDPTQVPPAYAAIPPYCQYNGTAITTDGKHTLYAAAEDDLDDGELPISVSFKVDLTPPTVRCSGPGSITYGTRGATEGARVMDSVSGPVKRKLRAGVSTARIGVHTVSFTGENRAGITNTVQCPYAVVPLALKPAPKLTWQFGAGATTTVDQLIMDHVPAGSTVDLRCHGGGCPFATARRGPVRRTQTVNLRSTLGSATLDTGSTLTVSVTRPHTTGRAWTFMFIGDAQPLHQVGCLAPGSTTRLGKNCRGG